MASSRSFWNMERGLLLLFLVICAGMILMAADYPTDARRFPQFIATIVGVLCAYLLINQYSGWRRENDPQQQNHRQKPVVAWTVIILMCVVTLLLIGAFGIGTGMLVFVTALAIHMGQRWYYSLLYGLLFSVFIWYTFGTLLRIPLPVGTVMPLF